MSLSCPGMSKAKSKTKKNESLYCTFEEYMYLGTGTVPTFFFRVN
jgi:hypothetical protein